MLGLPAAVLFACSENAVRSPMAEGILKHLLGHRIYVDSAGVRAAAQVDGFAVAVMEEIGIDSKDIQTMNYSIRLDRYPEQFGRVESATEEPQPMYRVSNMVNVTIRDLDSVGDVLDAVIEAGANDIWGITFAMDDPSQAQDEARAGAIDDALARAGALAELNGVALGPVMSVTEIVGSTPVPMPKALESAAAGGGPVSPGELEIGYQVQVTYFIER